MAVIAKVNGEAIDQEMLEAAVRRFIVQIEEDEESGFELTEANLKYVKTEALNQLVERRLLLQKARREGISVTLPEIQSRINALRAEFESEQDWESNLLAVGSDPERLSAEIEEDLLLEKQYQAVWGEEVSFTDEDLERYFQERQDQMKEPDLYSFHEIYVKSSQEVNEAAWILQNNSDLTVLKRDFAARNMEFQHYTDVPAGRLPEEIYNILSDLEVGKIGTMLAGDSQLIVYQLTALREGKRFSFAEIKPRLREYLQRQGRKEAWSNLVSQEIDRAEISYLDTSILEENGTQRHKKTRGSSKAARKNR